MKNFNIFGVHGKFQGGGGSQKTNIQGKLPKKWGLGHCRFRGGVFQGGVISQCTLWVESVLPHMHAYLWMNWNRPFYRHKIINHCYGSDIQMIFSLFGLMVRKDCKCFQRGLTNFTLMFSSHMSQVKKTFCFQNLTLNFQKDNLRKTCI